MAIRSVLQSKVGVRLLISSLFLFSQMVPVVDAYDLGLSTRFSDVILDNLQLGQTYNISQMKSLPLTIINSSTIDADVQVDVDAPKPDELKEGYEPIPDPTWVKVIPDRFSVVPAGRNLSDIIITIPNDPAYLNRHYQVMFWARTMNEGFLGVGVRVRFRFSIGTHSPEVTKSEIARKRMLDLNFRLDPVTVSAGTVSPGEKIRLTKDLNKKVKLVNTGATALNLALSPAHYVNPQRPPSGYEDIPDLSWVKVSPNKIKAKSDSITPIEVTLKVPDKPEYRGKKYAALIVVDLVGEAIPLNVYSQIIFETEK